jgi:HTH-type transcriptional regulator, glycine betaine synthesis regulator
MSDENAKGCASLKDITKHIIDACIQWARIKGYRDSTGILRGLTVVAKEPISLDELVLETGYSKSTVSSNMNILENLRLVRRIVMPGDKRHLYAPLTDPKTIRSNMLDAIDKEIRLFIVALDRTESAILSGGVEARFLLKRIVSLKQSYEQVKKIIDFLRNQSLNEIQEKFE